MAELRLCSMRRWLWLAVGIHALSVAVVAVVVGGSGWLALFSLCTFFVAYAAGTVIDQAVASSIFLVALLALALLAGRAPGFPVPSPLFGAAAGVAVGWAVSAILDWGFGLKIRRVWSPS